MNTQKHPPYRVYSEWLKAHYGQKVYKIPVNIPCTCPNRDGTVGTGGCIYCGSKGGGHENLSCKIGITEQVLKIRALIEKKYKAHAFIIFLQSFSNTYLPLERLQSVIEEILQLSDVVGIAVATRPDCIFEDQLAFFSGIQKQYGMDVCIECGLQTANDHTLMKINRGHRLGDYILAANQIKAHGLQLCTHVILDLPWDDRQDVITTAEVISAVRSDFVKCHALYVEKGTVLAEMVKSGEVNLLGQEMYIARCIDFLEHLRPETVLQRLIGRAPAVDSVMANWDCSWWKVKAALDREILYQKTWQGRLWREGYNKITSKLSKN